MVLKRLLSKVWLGWDENEKGKIQEWLKSEWVENSINTGWEKVSKIIWWDKNPVDEWEIWSSKKITQEIKGPKWAVANIIEPPKWKPTEWIEVNQEILNAFWLKKVNLEWEKNLWDEKRESFRSIVSQVVKSDLLIKMMSWNSEEITRWVDISEWGMLVVWENWEKNEWDLVNLDFKIWELRITIKWKIVHLLNNEDWHTFYWIQFDENDVDEIWKIKKVLWWVKKVKPTDHLDIPSLDEISENSTTETNNPYSLENLYRWAYISLKLWKVENNKINKLHTAEGIKITEGYIEFSLDWMHYFNNDLLGLVLMVWKNEFRIIWNIVKITEIDSKCKYKLKINKIINKSNINIDLKEAIYLITDKRENKIKRINAKDIIDWEIIVKYWKNHGKLVDISNKWVLIESLSKSNLSKVWEKLILRFKIGIEVYYLPSKIVRKDKSENWSINYGIIFDEDIPTDQKSKLANLMWTMSHVNK